MASGTKRTLSVLANSKALPVLAAKLKAVQLPAPSLYCQMPLLLVTALMAMAWAALAESGSAMRVLPTRLAMVLPVLVPSAVSSAIDRLMPALRIGASCTAVTSTFTAMAATDTAPSASLATTVKALSAWPALRVLLALAVGVQYARWVASIRSLLLAAQAVAAPALAPILSVPVLTAFTTMLVMLLSASASLPCTSSSVRVISTGVSSKVVSSAAANALSVGVSLTAVMFRVEVAAVLVCAPLVPLAALSVTCQVMVRLEAVAVGVSEVLTKVTERNAAW